MIGYRYPFILALACWIALPGALEADRQTLDETKTRYALPLPKPPDIDGLIDLEGEESWVWAAGAAGLNWRVLYDDNLEDFYRGGSPGDGNPVDPFDSKDLNYDIYVGYDEENLYVGVRVKDDIPYSDNAEEESEDGQTWNDDSVEVFIDGNNSNYPERNNSDPDVVDTGGQFVIALNNAFRDNEAGNPGYGEDAAWYARALDNGVDGYDAEFRISWEILGSPQPGDIIGFTIGVNDDDDGGPAERQILWTGSPHTEHTYGNLIIGGRSYEAPKHDAPTLDGKIEEGEYGNAPEVRVDRFTGVYNIPAGDDTWEPGDHSFSWKAVHDDEAVYVAAVVQDDELFNDTADAGSEDGQTWVDDSVEVFFDADEGNEQGRGMLLFEGQYVMTANGAWRDNEANNPQFGQSGDWYAVAAVAADSPDGMQVYTVEFRIDKSALSSPEDGTVMGFNIAINDDDGSGRKAQLNWSGRPHSEFTYGSITLAEEGGSGPPQLSLTPLEDGGYRVDFDGSLQFSTQVAGPWIGLPVTSPAIFDPSNPNDPLFQLVPNSFDQGFVRAIQP